MISLLFLQLFIPIYRKDHWIVLMITKIKDVPTLELLIYDPGAKNPVHVQNDESLANMVVNLVKIETW